MGCPTPLPTAPRVCVCGVGIQPQTIGVTLVPGDTPPWRGQRQGPGTAACRRQPVLRMAKLSLHLFLLLLLSGENRRHLPGAGERCRSRVPGTLRAAGDGLPLARAVLERGRTAVTLSTAVPPRQPLCAPSHSWALPKRCSVAGRGVGGAKNVLLKSLDSPFRGWNLVADPVLGKRSRVVLSGTRHPPSANYLEALLWCL